MTCALIVSKYLLVEASKLGISVCPMKLQKLVYYSQGRYMALSEGEKLFPEKIEVWPYGPVVSAVYHEYKCYGYRDITVPQLFDDSVFTTIQKELMCEVLADYGSLSASQLSDQTHQESPWLGHSDVNGKADGNSIKDSELMEFFTMEELENRYLCDVTRSLRAFDADKSLAQPKDVKSTTELMNWLKSIPAG